MTQTIVSIVLFLVVLALLPLAIRAYQQRAPRGNAVSLSSRVLSSVAVGPQQRVVTVEVGPQGRQVLMVLGVTATASPEVSGRLPGVMTPVPSSYAVRRHPSESSMSLSPALLICGTAT